MGKKSSRKKARRAEGEAPAMHADAAAARGRKWLGNLAAGAILALAAALGVFGWSHYSVGGLVASAQPAHGKVLYAQYCASCHGATGQGAPDWQSHARAAPALDSSGHAWHHEDAQLMSMILDKPAPDSRMPPWRTVLSRSDAADLIAYMKTLWSPYIRDNCQGARHMACMGAGS